jgi:hypothetical protein
MPNIASCNPDGISDFSGRPVKKCVLAVAKGVMRPGKAASGWIISDLA